MSDTRIPEEAFVKSSMSNEYDDMINDYEDMPPLVSDNSDDSDESSESSDVPEIRYGDDESDGSSVPSLAKLSDHENICADNVREEEDCKEYVGHYLSGSNQESDNNDDYDEGDDNYDDDENDTLNDGATVSSEISSDSNDDIPSLIPIFNPESPMYYCHFCKREILIQQIENGYPSCSICHNSFVEMLGQDLHLFFQPTQNADHPTRVGRSISNRNYNNPQRIQSLNRSSGIEVDSNHRASRIGIIVRRGGGALVRSTMTGNSGAAVRTGRTIQSFLGGASQHPVVQSLLESIIGSGNRHGVSRSLDELLSHIILAVDRNAGTPPASQGTIDILERETLTEHSDLLNNGEVCSISLETFKVEDKIVKLPCGHKFIEEPIVTWLKSHDSCPTCRVRVSE